MVIISLRTFPSISKQVFEVLVVIILKKLYGNKYCSNECIAKVLECLSHTISPLSLPLSHDFPPLPPPEETTIDNSVYTLYQHVHIRSCDMNQYAKDRS